MPGKQKFRISIYITNQTNATSAHLLSRKEIYRKETSLKLLHTVHYSGYKDIFTVLQHIILFLTYAFNRYINNHIFKEPHIVFKISNSYFTIFFSNRGTRLAGELHGVKPTNGTLL